jgi:hypothetical protein
VTSTPSPTSATANFAAASSTQLASLPFADDFESDDISKWTTVNDVGVQSGGYKSAAAAQAASNGSAGSTASMRLAEPQADLYARSAFNIAQSGKKTITLLALRSDDERIVSVFVSGTGKLSVSIGAEGSISRSAKAIPTGEWHEVEVHASIPSGRLEVWLDGQPVEDLSKSVDLGAQPITELVLGEAAKNRVYQVLFDNVAVDVNFIKPVIVSTPTPAPTPTSTPASTATLEPTEPATSTPTPTATPSPTPTETPTPEPPTETPVPDSDGDGVLDPQDQCPGDPDTGADSDSDGIDDACDPTPFGDPTATPPPTDEVTG